MSTGTAPLAEVEYFTDPYCSWCWATEPVLYRLRETYRDSLRIRYVMDGLVRDMADFYDGLNDIRTAAQVAPHWRDVSRRSGQPIDERLWEDITDPHFSTWPACIAVKAAQLQGQTLGERFLRQIRRAALAERRFVSDLEVQKEIVLDVPDLDAERWLEDVEGGRAPC
ncbi:MAG: DsbA family protein [Chloroflexi bacterium]|nr:DsbA family protein [Chloroflexota bacterium]